MPKRTELIRLSKRLVCALNANLQIEASSSEKIRSDTSPKCEIVYLNMMVLTLSQWAFSIDKFVECALAEEISEHSSVGSYKVTLINDERKKVMAEFLKRVLAKKKCENCGAYARTIRRDGFTKLFQLPLPRKQQMYMDAQGMVMGDVLLKKKPNGISVRDGTEINTVEVEEADEDREDDERNGIIMTDGEPLEGSEEEDDGDSDNDGNEDDLAEAKVNGKRTPSDTSEDDRKRLAGGGQTYMSPLEVRSYIRLLFEKEQDITTLLYGARAPQNRKEHANADIFFIDVLPVAPTRFRPASVLGDKQFESPQNELLGKVLMTCERIRDLNNTLTAVANADTKSSLKIEEIREFDLLVSGIIQLQQDVNSFIDSTKNPISSTKGQIPIGIRQVLEKKEGLFRKHMMGKRVNYAARSVISPDPNIETSEIGIPPVFAKKLTYPEPVSHYNIKEMMRAVINGPEKWPGAVFVQHEDGSLTSLVSWLT